MKFILKFVLIVAVIALILASVWFVVTQPILTPPATKASVSVDPARLEGYVRGLSETLSPRTGSNLQNMNRVSSYISKVFAWAGGRVVEQTFDDEGKAYRNVSAHFGPETEDRIVVGAHYDAYGDSPGADANASGVAGLFELAKLLQKAPLKTQVELVAYALEEPPYWGTPRMGSAVHAFSLKTQNRGVRIMICLDMIGCFSDKEGSQKYPVKKMEWLYSPKGDFIGVVGNLGQMDAVRRVKTAMAGASPLPVFSINAPLFFSGIGFSDHRNYWQTDYPAVMITDTAVLRNPNYHTAKDTAETLDYKRMGMVVQGVYAAVLDFDK
jgi:Zn-dependent M28 family amino/carboxypeptidase